MQSCFGIFRELQIIDSCVPHIFNEFCYAIWIFNEKREKKRTKINNKWTSNVWLEH